MTALDDDQMVKTFYEILDVDSDANDAEIKKSYLRLIRKWHPDLKGEEGAARTSAINEAYNVLKDSELRAEYDEDLGFESTTLSGPSPYDVDYKTTNSESESQEAPGGPSDASGAHHADDDAESAYREPETPRMRAEKVKVTSSPLFYRRPRPWTRLLLALAAFVVVIAGLGTLFSVGSMFGLLGILSVALSFACLLPVAGVLPSLTMTRVLLVLHAIVFLVVGIVLATKFEAQAFLVISVLSLAADLSSYSLGLSRVEKLQAKKADEWVEFINLFRHYDTIRLKGLFFVVDTQSDGKMSTILAQSHNDSEPSHTIHVWGDTKVGNWILVSTVGTIISQVGSDTRTAYRALAISPSFPTN